jgi:lytic murein transglycosylase
LSEALAEENRRRSRELILEVRSPWLGKAVLAGLIAASVPTSGHAETQTILVPAPSSVAQAGSSSAIGFEPYKAYLAQEAAKNGINDAGLLATIPLLPLNLRAIELDRAQRPGTGGSLRSPPLQPYLRQHVTPSLIRRGQSLYHRLWPQLWRIEQLYGVDSATLLAIYGKETSYGAYTGGFDLLEVLASLAYEGRRRAMFEAEFFATLKLLQSGVPRATLRGSYAGATGLPQFMPTVVLRLRADGDGDGMADIWRNDVDALASIANYFRDAGWKPGLRWGGMAQVPAGLERAALRNPQEEARCPAVFRRHSRPMSIAEWRVHGVALGVPLPDSEPAALIEPEGAGEKPYLLTSNYRAILSYNCSNAYALSVALLSDAIARR